MYRWLFRNVLARLSPERAHHLGFGLLRFVVALPLVRGWLARATAPRDRRLSTHALGLDFPGPLGLAAGFDKDALGPDALSALGFSFVEIGTVTAQPQPGNAKPRLFRLPNDRALVNRMGFNNEGSEATARRLARRPRSGILGINLGKTKVVPESEAAADYATSARRLGPYADYCVVNVSSPNTPGLRDLQRTEALAPILASVRSALDEACPQRRIPLLVKIAPDLADADIDAVADLALELGLDGIVATNTTIRREPLESSTGEIEQCGAGGLSGPPVKARALEVIGRLYRRVGKRLVLVGVGGIETGRDAFDRIAHGATLLQAYTGFVYRGPAFAAHVHRELARELAARGFVRVADAVGSACDEAASGALARSASDPPDKALPGPSSTLALPP